MQVTNCNTVLTKTCINTISRCLKHLDHTIFNSLQIAITKTSIYTTRRRDLIYGLIFDTVRI